MPYSSPFDAKSAFADMALIRIFSIVLVMCGALGCGSVDEALQVGGTVKFADGSPVTGESATVVFMPTTSGQGASGSIEPDGSFELMTKQPGDGVQPGQYKVVLKVFKNYREQILAVPEKYGDETITPLEATVDEEHTHFDFVIEK